MSGRTWAVTGRGVSWAGATDKFGTIRVWETPGTKISNRFKAIFLVQQNQLAEIQDKFPNRALVDWDAKEEI